MQLALAIEAGRAGMQAAADRADALSGGGGRFGRLVVTGEPQRDRGWWWVPCRCDCGRDKRARLDRLRCGATQSCGCLHRERFSRLRHGFSVESAEGYSTHTVWTGMRARCRNPSNRSYRLCGGRGIRVCERWESFENFLADMGVRPPGATLDRIDVNGNYEPANCRWASKAEQGRNQRRNTINHAIATEIRRRADAGERLIRIAESMGVLYSTVKQVAGRHQWWKP